VGEACDPPHVTLDSGEPLASFRWHGGCPYMDEYWVLSAGFI